MPPRQARTRGARGALSLVTRLSIARARAADPHRTDGGLLQRALRCRRRHVIVPLLILAGGWEMRSATATPPLRSASPRRVGVIRTSHGRCSLSTRRSSASLPPRCTLVARRSSSGCPFARFSFAAARRDRHPDAAPVTSPSSRRCSACRRRALRPLRCRRWILFVLILTRIGLTQLYAEASSPRDHPDCLRRCLAPAAVGGNVRWRPAVILGVSSIAAAVGGAQVAVSRSKPRCALFGVLIICGRGKLPGVPTASSHNQGMADLDDSDPARRRAVSARSRVGDSAREPGDRRLIEEFQAALSSRSARRVHPLAALDSSRQRRSRLRLLRELDEAFFRDPAHHAEAEAARCLPWLRRSPPT
jgi:hypothetical protein